MNHLCAEFSGLQQHSSTGWTRDQYLGVCGLDEPGFYEAGDMNMGKVTN